MQKNPADSNEFDDEVLHPLSHSGVMFLRPIVEHADLSHLLLTSNDLDHLAQGIVRLRSTIAPQKQQKHDYVAVMRMYLESNGGVVSVHERLLPLLSVASVQGIIRRIQQSCLKAISGPIDIGTLIDIGTQEDTRFSVEQARLLGTTAFDTSQRERAVNLKTASVQRTADEYDPDDSMAWRKDALCAQIGHTLFFPEGIEKTEMTRDAKEVCKACEVRQLCADYALRYDERIGVWGGLSENERSKLRKRQKRYS